MCLYRADRQNGAVEVSPETSKNSKRISQWNSFHLNNWYTNNKISTLNYALQASISTDNSSNITKLKSDQNIVKSALLPPREVSEIMLMFVLSYLINYSNGK